MFREKRHLMCSNTMRLSVHGKTISIFIDICMKIISNN